MSDNQHAEWLLFRQGSLRLQDMPNNIETPRTELIKNAENSFTKMCILPKTPSGRAKLYTGLIDNEPCGYFVTAMSFHGIVIIPSAPIITNETQVLIFTKRADGCGNW